jgi:hypothetical protein
MALRAARADQSNLVPLTISVFNEVELSADAVEHAETRAGLVLAASGIEVLAASGIEVIWIQCKPVPSGQFGLASPTACASLAYPAHLSVRILSQSDTQSEHACGYSWLDEEGKGVRAAAFYSCVVASAQGHLDGSELLGYVIAHEVGHLLLGPHAHSLEGLMRAHWGQNELHEAALGNLYFSSHEEARLRSRLEASSRFTEQSKHATQSGK